MDRTQALAKIKAMLALQENTDFDGEAAAAANLIDRLCKQYGVTVTEATEVRVTDEIFFEGGKISVAAGILLNAVATFYDAVAYSKSVRNGKKSLVVIGSEGQQIQTRLYYDFLLEVMEKECDKAHKAEKILAELTGGTLSKGFKANFRKAFSSMVSKRLGEMKAVDNRKHDDADATALAVAERKFSKGGTSYCKGDGANAGYSSGSSVSLNKQAAGGRNLALAGY